MTGDAWAIIVAAFAFVGTVIGIVAAISRVSDRLTKAEAANDAAKRAEAAAEEAHGTAVKALGELADFREKVAREYATASMVAAVEGRIVTAIDRLADRLDRILENRPTPARTPRPKV